MKTEAVSLILLVVLSGAVLIWDSCRQVDVLSVSRTAAIDAIDRITAWTTWLTGIETAAIAAIGLLVKDRGLYGSQRRWGFFGLLFVGTSLLFSVWLIASLPNIVLQLDASTSPINDVLRAIASSEGLHSQ
jgi:hypothetical protein